MTTPAHARWVAAKAALGFINLKVADARGRVQGLESALKDATYDLEQITVLHRLADAELMNATAALQNEARDAETWKP